MATITTYDGFIARKLAGYDWKFAAARATQATGTAPLVASSGDSVSMIRMGTFEAFPGSFETGVTGYVPTTLYSYPSNAIALLIGEQFLLGSIDISGTTGANYAAMPTRTEGNNSHVIPGLCVVECTTGLNSNAGSLVIQYKDQANNAAENSRTITLGNSATAGMASSMPFNTGDMMITEVTALTRSGGSSNSGVIKVYGVIPLAVVQPPVGQTSAVIYDLLGAQKYRKYGTSAQLGVWAFNTAGTQSVWTQIKMIGDS